MAGGGSSSSQADSYQETRTTTQNINLQGIEGAATVVSANEGATVTVTDGGAIQNAFNYLSQANTEMQQSAALLMNNTFRVQSEALNQAGRAGELAMRYVSEAENPGSDSAEQQKMLIIAAAAVAGLAILKRAK